MSSLFCQLVYFSYLSLIHIYAEKELKSLEDRRNVLQPIMDNASKEIKEYGMIKTFLPEAGTFERAVPYRENKIKPLFIKMKNQIAALAGKVVELNKTVESWKNKYQKSAEKCVDIQKQFCLLYTSRCV